MPITETWRATLGVEGSAGWNKYGSFDFGNGPWGHSSFSVVNDGLEFTAIGDDLTTYHSNIYTWHGLTPDSIFGKYEMQYRVQGLEDGSLYTAFAVGQNAGGTYLWIRDKLEGSNNRNISFRTSPGGLGSTTTVIYAGNVDVAGPWKLNSLGMSVSYTGDGTWKGSFTGTVGTSGTVCVITAIPSGYGTFTPICCRHGIRVYAASLAADEDVVWQCDHFTMPYTRCEWTSPSDVMFIGTWYEGGVQQVGYLPLGDRLMSCSDIVDYAYQPLEYRGWSSSCSITLADNDKFIRNSVLGYLVGTEHLFGRFVIKKAWDGAWSTLFSGIMNEQPVYNYLQNTVDIHLESYLSSLQNKTFDFLRDPFKAGHAGNWYWQWSNGTYSVTSEDSGRLARIIPGAVLYVQGTSDITITIKDVIHESVTYGESRTRRLFTIKESLPSVFTLGATIHSIPPWPSISEALEIRENPSLLLTELISNMELSIEETDYQSWISNVSETFLDKFPLVSYKSKVLPIFNEVCATLNTAYTVSPEGRIRLFSIDTEPVDPPEIYLGEHYGKKFAIENAAPISEVSVEYGFDEDNNGPDKTILVENQTTTPLYSSESISSRFLSSEVSAYVAGYRAIRRYEGAVPTISLDLEGSYWQSITTGGGVQVMDASDFLGSAAPIGAVWSVVLKSYNREQDQTTVYLSSRYPTVSWVSWGSSIADNKGCRWF